MKQNISIDFGNVRTADFDYRLPESRIAKYPLTPRDASKLLVYDCGEISHDIFGSLPHYIGQSDLMVFNETKVINARLNFRKPTGAQLEVFCLEPLSPSDYEQAFQAGSGCIWKCAVGNLKKWKAGLIDAQADTFKGKLRLKAEKLEREDNAVQVKFHWDDPEIQFGDILDASGKIPIPPYLNRESTSDDTEQYQTVYSRIKGSVAAPTAGLHFTPEVLGKLTEKGVPSAFLNLYVGAGTFRPVSSETAKDHRMHSERFSVTLDELMKIKQSAGRITAVGTTSVRTLESLYWLGVKALQKHNSLTHFLSQTEINRLPQTIPADEALSALFYETKKAGKTLFDAATQIFIVPGYRFRLVNKIITNFHLPKSTLLMLTAAFTGEDWKAIYNYALKNNFRFLSYGDSSLLIPKNHWQ